uniref:Uncharacterized protein n=1 Tax=Siphoviridae sp. ctuUw41 TaxID=2826503 RepID=A0A8S5MYL1_9CAUD|nr:MAG TPA: hypothetical protein [Siphoviridae sp. ctuUw41]
MLLSISFKIIMSIFLFIGNVISNISLHNS